MRYKSMLLSGICLSFEKQSYTGGVMSLCYVIRPNLITRVSLVIFSNYSPSFFLHKNVPREVMYFLDVVLPRFFRGFEFETPEFEWTNNSTRPSEIQKRSCWLLIASFIFNYTISPYLKILHSVLHFYYLKFELKFMT